MGGGILGKIDFYAFKSPKPFYIEIDSIADALGANLLTPQEIAKQCATDGKAQRLKGITNINYKINFDGKEKVIRIPSVGTEKCINRSVEKLVLELIAPLKITPHNDFYANGIKMSDFLSDFRSSEFSDINDDFLCAVVLQIKKLHAIKYDKNLNIPRITMMGEIKKYESLCQIPLTTPKEHKFLLDIAREMDRGEFVLCHRDLQLPNIMVSNLPLGIHSADLANRHKARTPSPLSLCRFAKNYESNTANTSIVLNAKCAESKTTSDSAEVSCDGFVGCAGKFERDKTDSLLSENFSNSRKYAQETIVLKFVDFEYAGFSPIAWELGNFSAELCLSESQIQNLAQIYGNISIDDIYKGQLISNYIWTLWSYIYHRIDLARDYLARFDRNLKALA